jgi:hypothetical protein
MAIFDPNLIAALVLRKALVRATRVQRAFAEELRATQRLALATPKTRKFYRDRLPPLTPDELAQIGRAGEHHETLALHLQRARHPNRAGRSRQGR